MGLHGSTTVHTSVQADLGRDCEARTSGEGDAQVQEYILDEAFVERVRATYETLDFTGVAFRDFVATVVIGLFKPEDSALASLKDVERALTHLADSGSITLPDFVEVTAGA